MKYLISIIIYMAIISVVSGFVGFIFGQSFIEGVFTDNAGRWFVRLVFASLFTANKTIELKNLL